MNLCFFGVGGVGGYFGTLVTRQFTGEHDIYFIARGKHKEAICANGLTLNKEAGEEIITVHPACCTDSTADVPVCDIVVLSVKSYDLPQSARELDRITGDNTIILPLLNGVDIYDRIRTIIDKGIILPSCVYVGTHIESPGVIFQKGGNCRICMGADPRYPDYQPELLFTILQQSSIDFSWETDVRVAIWSKFMFIAAYGLVTATYNTTLGGILENEVLNRTTRAIMEEIYAIAVKMKIPLSADIVEASYSKAKLFPYDTKTSFQRDVEAKGTINEGDLLGGTIIRYGKDLGVPVPVTVEIYRRLRDVM